MKTLIISVVFIFLSVITNAQVYSTTMVGNKSGVISKNTEIVSSDYFEISLYSMRKGAYYTAQKDIENLSADKNSKLVNMSLTDAGGVVLKFKTSVEFLNYMSKNGYELTEQVKEKHRIDYTFKRKSK